MNVLREYSWKDWMQNPKNKELYNRDMSEGLRQFKLEQLRRNKLVQVANFNQKGY